MKKCPKCGNEYPDTTTLCPADGVGLETSGDSLLGQTLADKYRIDERLNEGGMGTVYRGTHVLMDKTVAIKVLRPSLAADEKIVARFSREARAASRISHPHALSVTDFGEAENGVVFLVMEFLNGQTLKNVIRQDGPMPLARVVEIIRQVGAALDAAHEQGVVHRDLKSENIMLLAANGPDYAKVLDFGIAKIKEHDGDYDPGLTAPDLVIGTPQYMSPEQCSQAPDIDARSDIYSLGVIIYEMLVGHVPFTGPSPTSIMMKQLQEPVPSVLVERNDLPASVGRVISRAMAKQPADRYQAVGELVEDLTIAAGVAVPAPTPVPMTAAANRIVVPTRTGENELLEDEVTVVRRRLDTTPGTGANAVPALPPASGVNPWKILIPALAGLLVVFAVVYVFTRGSQPAANANQTEPTLVADPNSQAVEPSPPPTGSAEQGIPAGGVTNNQVVDANANANANANASESPTPEENVNAEINANSTNENANANSNRPATNPPLWLAENLKGVAAVICDPDRIAAGFWAIEHLGSDVFVLDDGFQHLQLSRDLNLLTIDASNPWGGGQLLPSGRLRENPRGAARADCVIITRADADSDTHAVKTKLENLIGSRPVLTSRMRTNGFRELAGRRLESGVVIAQPVAAFCAVGNPDSFFEHLRKEGLSLAYTRAFPDHLQYQQADVTRLSDEAKRNGAASLITTAKDAVKLRELEFGLPCYVLEIEISIDEEEKLRDLIRTKLSSS